MGDHRIIDDMAAPGPTTSGVYVQSEPTARESSMPPPSSVSQKQARNVTFTSRNGSRLSLNFPVQATERNELSKQAAVSSTPSTVNFPSGGNDSCPIPNDESSDFMVVLAAQERRVLELKEELSRAENELTKLKRTWAVYEANKKRPEIRFAEQSQSRPVQQYGDVDVRADVEVEESIVRRDAELGRRKALLIAVPRETKRTIISGGHTRTLSLLSPDRATHGQFAALQSLDGRYTADGRNSVGRGNTTPDNVQSSSQMSVLPRSRHSYQDAATVGVKQIADDLRAGLWTFVEDLRQATIGQEALQNPLPRHSDNTRGITKKPSRANLSGRTIRQRSTSGQKSLSRSRQAQVKSVPSPVEVRKGMEKDSISSIQTPRSGRKTDSGLAGLDDDWANWDSPCSKVESLEPKEAETAEKHKQDGSPSASKSRKSSLSSQDEAAWPALHDFSPGNLKRTASAIMKEWERSLTQSTHEHTSPPGHSHEEFLTQEYEARLSLSNLP